MGYHEAGFDILGIDWKPQRRYPFNFIQADIEADFDHIRWLIRRADAVHASPPCQFATELNNDKSKHKNLIPVTRILLNSAGKPYVIENVVGARDHLRDPISITGLMLDMHMVTSKGQRFDLERERLFETNWPLLPPCDMGGGDFPIANVFGGHLRCRSGEYRTGGNTGKTVDFPGEDRPALAKALMEMPWATMGGMSEAVPPPFTAFVGEQLIGRI